MNLVETQGLCKRYGSAVALDSVTLEVPAGEPVALIGPNGAGKTTLLSVLCGYIRVSSGTVSVLGHSPGSQALNGRLAALPQDALLDPNQSVGRQLRLFAKLQGMRRVEAHKDVDRVLECVDLAESIKARPGDLSHGMRKRISIAQALLGSPELVLLDEPTAGIDPPNAKLIRDLIRQQSTHTTFVVSSHNLDELERLCTQVVYLEKGKLISSGPLAEDTEDQFLTLRMGKIDEPTFLEAVSVLPGVLTIRRAGQGDYIVETANDLQASSNIMQLLHEKGWRYRQISCGKTLEERLYGSSMQ